MGVSPVSTKILTQPSVEPISLYDCADRLRLEVGDDTRMMTALIKGARQYVETRIGQKIVRQKWRAYWNCFHDEMLLLPYTVRELVQIQYVDTDGATQTLSSSYYTADIPGQVVRLAYDQTWPSTRDDYNAVWVDVWSGMYDETASPVNVETSVPEDLKQAIVLQVQIMHGAMTPIEQEAAERARDMLLRSHWMPQ